MLTGHLMLSSPHLQFISCIKRTWQPERIKNFLILLLHVELPAGTALLSGTNVTQAAPNRQCLQSSPYVAKINLETLDEAFSWELKVNDIQEMLRDVLTLFTIPVQLQLLLHAVRNLEILLTRYSMPGSPSLGVVKRLLANFSANIFIQQGVPAKYSYQIANHVRWIVSAASPRSNNRNRTSMDSRTELSLHTSQGSWIPFSRQQFLPVPAHSSAPSHGKALTENGVWGWPSKHQPQKGSWWLHVPERQRVTLVTTKSVPSHSSVQQEAAGRNSCVQGRFGASHPTISERHHAELLLYPWAHTRGQYMPHFAISTGFPAWQHLSAFL